MRDQMTVYTTEFTRLCIQKAVLSIVVKGNEYTIFAMVIPSKACS